MQKQTTTEKPYRNPSVESDVAVPLLQAFIFSLAAWALAAFGLLAIGAELSWPAYVALFIAVFGLAWLWRQGVVGETIWTIERVTGVDLDGDGDVGEPDPAWPVTLSGPQTAQAKQERRQQMWMDEFSAFVRGCELDTSARRWENTIGRQRYTAWRDKLIDLGWAEWNSEGNPQQGWALSYDADEIIEAVGFEHFSRQFVRELTAEA